MAEKVAEKHQLPKFVDKHQQPGFYDNPMRKPKPVATSSWGRHFGKVILIGSLGTYATMKFLNASQEIWRNDDVADYETLNHGRNLRNDQSYKDDWRGLQRQIEMVAASDEKTAMNDGWKTKK